MTLGESLSHEQDERERLRQSYKTVRAYTGDNCNNPDCGRNRVIVYANGKHVCEKCHWDQSSHEYDHDHMDLFA